MIVVPAQAESLGLKVTCGNGFKRTAIESLPTQPVSWFVARTRAFVFTTVKKSGVLPVTVAVDDVSVICPLVNSRNGLSELQSNLDFTPELA